jgi:signal peptidase I
MIDGRIFASPPERGDVVVFKKPPENKQDYIKRVIGLPGDSIQVIGGILHINDTAVVRRELGATKYVDQYGRVQHVIAYVETLPNGVEHRIFEVSDDQGNRDNTEVFNVPPGHYFMMGDNRDNSSDSRFDVGYVPFRNLVGRAEFLFFSHDENARLFKPWTWPTALRYRRFFDGVE